MKIKNFAYRGMLAGSLLAFILVACVSPNQNNSSVTKLAPVSKPNAVSAVPAHPLKRQAKSPPQKKKLFFFNARYEDVWERIRGDFRLEHDHDNPRVQAHIRWFQKHPEYVERVTQRATPYIYLIVEELERRNMPKEVALLPMIESAFNPLAYSPAHAAGLWQMIPGTAKVYGIQMDNYYDGRQDVYAATNSALDYLTKLSNDFNGDWLLVFAAYNTGEGNVQRSINNNRRARLGTNFWSLKVHNETHEYVPRLLALCHIIKHAEKYGINLPKVDNKSHVQMVNVGRQINLDLAAQLAGMSLFELKQYNPGYKSWATSPTGPHHLLLPHAAAQKFSANLAALPRDHHFGITKRTMVADNSNNFPASTSNNIKNKVTHTVKSGETLSNISKKYKVNLNQLAAWNGIAVNKPLKIGQKLAINSVVPIAIAANHNKPAVATAAPAPTNKNKSVTHLTASKDKNGAIAKNPKAKENIIAEKKSVIPQNTTKKSIITTEKNIANRNKIVNKSTIATKPTNKTITYSVKQGDSIFKIAKQFGVKQNDLVKWNHLAEGNKLKVGQKLKINAG